MIVCTGISMKILLYLVPKYAPDQKKLEGSLRKLKSVKFSLAICAGFCIFFRFVKVMIVGFDDDVDYDVLSGSGSKFLLAFSGSVFLSLASYSSYVGPFAIARCSFTPLYDHLQVASRAGASGAGDVKGYNWISKLYAFGNLISSFVPTWDKTSEVQRKTAIFLETSKELNTSEATRGKSLFASDNQPQSNNFKTSVRPNAKVPFQDVHAKPSIDKYPLHRFIYPTRASIPPLQTSLMSLFINLVCSVIYAYFMAKLYIPSNCSVSSVILVIWMTTAAGASFRFKLLNRFRHEIPLANLYYLPKDKIFDFILNSIQEAAIEESFPYLVTMQLILAAVSTKPILEAYVEDGLFVCAYYSILAFGGAIIISLALISQFTLIDCAVGLICSTKIGLRALTRETNARSPSVPILLALCSEFKDLIPIFDRPLASASSSTKSFKSVPGSFDQEMEEIRRNDAIINDISALLLASEINISALSNSNDSNFYDEISRAIILECLGGERDWNDMFDFAKASKYYREVSMIVDCDPSLSVPVARAMIGFIGTMGESLLRIYNCKMPGEKIQDHIVICTLPSGMLLQTQFSLIGATRILQYTFAKKGRHHPLTWLQNALLDSIFRLRSGLARHALAKSNLVSIE